MIWLTKLKARIEHPQCNHAIGGCTLELEPWRFTKAIAELEGERK